MPTTTTAPSTTLRPALGRALAAAALGLLLAPAAFAAADAKGEEFFTAKVWPIIDTSCTGCHGEKKQKAKLRLDSREGWLKGGEDGKIVVPGDPDKSDVMTAIKREAKDEDQNMPPKKDKALSKEQVAIIGEWIKMGMPWPKK
jgi:mono/diheme cytochrome c family protein